jgi:hypothetical protein
VSAVRFCPSAPVSKKKLDFLFAANEHSANFCQIVNNAKNPKAEIRKPSILENYYQILLEKGLKGHIWVELQSA